MKYRYLEKVSVKNGFYRGYTGIIKNVSKQKDESYIYGVDLNIKEKVVAVELGEDLLSKVWF